MPRIPARRITAALRAAGPSRIMGERGFPDLPGYLQGTPWAQSPYSLEFPKAVKLVPTVYTCVTRIAEDIASLQPTFYRRKKDGQLEKIEREKGNIADRWEQANPVQNCFQLEVARQASMDLSGTGYLFVDRHKIKDPSVIDLWNLPGHLVEVVPGPNRIPLGYVFTYEGKPWWIDFENMIPFPHWHPEGEFAGLSPLEAARLSYETRFNSAQWNSEFYRKGAAVSGVYTTTERARALTSEKAKEYKEELMARHSGIMRAFEPVILDGLKYERGGITHKEMAFLESNASSDADVCRVYKIQPAIIGIREGGMLSDTGVQADMIQHITSCLGPRLKIRDMILTEWLCPLFGEDIVAQTDLSGVPAIAKQNLELADMAAKLVGKIWSVNEARQVSGKPPTGKPEHDEVTSEVEQQAQIDAKAAEQAAQIDAGNADKPKPKPKQPVAESAPMPESLRSWGLELRDDSDDLLEDEEHDRFYLERELARLIKSRGRLAAAEVGVKLALDAQALTVQRFVQAKSAIAIRNVNDTTRSKLRETLVKLTGPGTTASFEEIKRAIDGVFQGRRANVVTIARTETLPAFNFATLEGWRQSGEVEAKVWSTSNDEVVRHAHNELEGVEVAMGQVWTMRGDDGKDYVCEYPGDETLPPELKINCRCTVDAVVSERLSKLGITMTRVAKKARAEAMLAASEAHVRGIFRRMLARQRRRVQERIERKFKDRARVALRPVTTIEELLAR